MRLVGWCAFGVTAAISSVALAEPQFEAVDGYVVMEAESVPVVMGWSTTTPADAMAENARGDVRYFDDPDASICSTSKGVAEGFPAMEYHFRVSEPGVYWLKMNMRKEVHCVSVGNDGDACHSGAGCTSFGIQSNGDSCDGADVCWRSDISNDAFVALETATGDGVPFVGGHTDIMKFFGGNSNAYGWSGNGALDHNAPTYDLAAGDYVLLVRGRSRGLKIDRIILVHDEADEGAAKEAPETLYSSPPGTGGAGGTDPSGGAGAGPGSGSGSGSGGDDPVAAGSGGMGGDDGNGLDGGAEDDGGCTMGGAPAGDVPGSVALLALCGATAVIRRRR